MPPISGGEKEKKMKIINNKTNEILAEIVGGNNLTLDSACNLMDIPVMQTAEDYAADNGYHYDDLELVPDDWTPADVTQ